MALKVLLADDSVPAQNMGKKILVEAGYEVMTVGNGLEAMRKIKEVAPDVAILDIFMPGYSGLEVCRFLRADDKTAGMPVILTVGKLEPYRPEDGEGVRSNAVLVKPFAAEELTSAVRSLAGGGGQPAPSEAEPTPEQAKAVTAAEVLKDTPPQKAAKAETVTEAPEAAAAEEAVKEEAPAASAIENTAAKAAAAGVAYHTAQHDSAHQDDQDEPPATYQPAAELLETALDRFGAERNEVGIDGSGKLGGDPERLGSAGAMFTPGAERTTFQASVFDTIGSHTETSEEGQTSVFALDQSALSEFEISPEPLLSAMTVDPEAGQKSWYAAEEIDPEMDYSVKPGTSEAEPLALAENGILAVEEAPVAEAGAPLRSVEPASVDASPSLPEEAAAEVLSETEPLLEVSETEDALSSHTEAFAQQLSEPAAELELAEGTTEMVAKQAVPDEIDEACADAQPASGDPVFEEQARADSVAEEPVQVGALPFDEDARREAFEALFNSDVPFPLQNDSSAPPMQAETAETIEAAEPLQDESEPPAEAAEAAENVTSDALSEAEPFDEPHFYTAETEDGLLQSAEVKVAAASKEEAERTELVAEVAKVGALLAQMEARRQAETEPDAAFATQEAPAEEIESPEESASFGMAEGTEEPADPAAEIESATLQTGSEVEAFLPAPAQEEPEEAVVEAEEALAEALATQAAGAMAPEQDDATQEGRIQGAVEKVFERFRPLLVEAIAKELRRRD